MVVFTTGIVFVVFTITDSVDTSSVIFLAARAPLSCSQLFSPGTGTDTVLIVITEDKQKNSSIVRIETTGQARLWRINSVEWTVGRSLELEIMKRVQRC